MRKKVKIKIINNLNRKRKVLIKKNLPPGNRKRSDDQLLEALQKQIGKKAEIKIINNLSKKIKVLIKNIYLQEIENDQMISNL